MTDIIRHKGAAPAPAMAPTVELECGLRILPSLGGWIVQCKPPDATEIIEAPVANWKAACALGAELVNQMARDLLTKSRERRRHG